MCIGCLTLRLLFYGLFYEQKEKSHELHASVFDYRFILFLRSNPRRLSRCARPKPFPRRATNPKRISRAYQQSPSAFSRQHALSRSQRIARRLAKKSKPTAHQSANDAPKLYRRRSDLRRLCNPRCRRRTLRRSATHLAAHGPSRRRRLAMATRPRSPIATATNRLRANQTPRATIEFPQATSRFVNTKYARRPLHSPRPQGASLQRAHYNLYRYARCRVPYIPRARRARACSDRTMIYIDTLCDRPPRLFNKKQNYQSFNLR